jgi:membrane-bound inhibitor of C-type lysozyme
MIRLARLVLIIGCSMSAGGCVHGSKTPREIVYQCDQGRGFMVAFYHDPERAVVRIDDRRMELPQVPSASGAQYSDGTATVWTKGPEVLVALEKAAGLQNCRVAWMTP